MINPYEPKQATIQNIKDETSTIRLFTLKFKNDKDRDAFRFDAGQIIEVSMPGYGEAPFAVCSSPLEKEFFQICVQKKGTVTQKLFNLRTNDIVWIRGPYGNGFPKNKMRIKNIVLIAGGLGLVPLRSIIRTVLLSPDKFKKVQIYHGCREMEMLLFRDEYEKWEKRIELNFTLDAPCELWHGNIGLITALIDKVPLLSDPTVVMCGPPVMFKFIADKLKAQNISSEYLYMSLERRMHCAIGICQHCVLIGGQYVCKDGPVFRYDRIRTVHGAI